MKRFIVFAMPLLLPTVAAANDTHSPLDPSRITELIEHELDDKDIDGVEITVDGTEVTLTGQVRSAWEKRKAAELARKTHDVASVVNRLDVARAENDEQIAREIARKVRRYVFYTVYDHVEFRVQDGRVTLNGKVTADYKADEIGNLAAKVYGVQAVRNEIETLSASTFDMELRRRIARQIYDDPMFWTAAVGPDPPIHVIVDGGDVTLTGVVGSEGQKVRAGMIARSTFGVFEVDNQLRVD